jgi:hypothetical protein
VPRARPQHVAPYSTPRFNETSIDQLSKVFSNNPLSSLRTLSFGTIKPTSVNVEHVFKHFLANSPSLILCSVSVAAKTSTQDAVYTNLKKNDCTLTIRYNQSIQRHQNHASPFKMMYTEYALAEGTGIVELMRMYNSTIRAHEEQYSVAVPHRMHHIWPKDMPAINLTADHLFEESSSSILVGRYLLAQGPKVFTGHDLSQLYILTAKNLLKDTTFSDGLSSIHKTVLYGNISLLKAMLKANINILTVSAGVNAGLPSKRIIISRDQSIAVNGYYGQMGYD